MITTTHSYKTKVAKLRIALLNKSLQYMIRQGTKVRWKWGSGHAEGKVKELHKSELEKTLKGTTVKRHGTEDDPALLIEQEDGTQVLKLQSEVERAE